MITRIEIDGFKSFVNFSVNLKPFQILIGANGVGKSNLFDAIILLSDLARGDTLYEALRKNRGEIGELFTQYPSGERAKKMKFAVEMLIDTSVEDDFGVEAKVSSTRLRYELEIERNTDGHFERLYIPHESLTALTEENDKWYLTIPVKKRRLWVARGRRSPYISTNLRDNTISKHQDNRSGGKQETPIGRIERPILSSVNNVEYPTAFAARKEMQNWRYFQFDPASLRKPSSVFAPDRLLPDGSNLPTVLERMAREDEYLLADVSIEMANLIPGILNIRVETLKERQEYIIYAQTVEGSTFSSTVLSDGTLRVLALSALKNDLAHHGLLCFEEPENGVHPSRLSKIIELFQQLSTQFDREGEEEQKLRQVFLNTHSPKLLSCAPIDTFLFMFVARQHDKPRHTQISTISDGLLEDNSDTRALKVFTKAKVIEYLDLSEQRQQLESLAHMEMAPSL
jgi:predicted ATPase